MLGRVLVVGAGSAGTATAILLARAGVGVDLVELRHRLATGGSGITLQGNALRVLREAGVWERVRDQGHAFDGLGLRAPDGALLAEVDGLGVPVWLSLTTAGDRTRRGELAAEAYDMAADVAEVVAAGANCLDPGDVPAVLDAVARAGLPAVVYPNAGEVWDGAARRWTGTPTFDPQAARSWVEDGACLIGGCCRVGPALVRRLAAVL